MATRLYGVANTAAPISLPNPDANWGSTTGFVRRSLSKTKAAATETRANVSVTSGAGNETLGFQLISEPIAAQTISGTVTIVTRGRELATSDNIGARVRVIKVVSNDGSTVRGTLLAFGNHSTTTEFGTSLTGLPAASSTSLTSVSAQAGDRIVVELGYGMTTTGTSPLYDMVIGGNGTDHANSNGDTTGTVPWIEFSANLVFLQEISAATQTVTASLAATADSTLPGGQQLVAVYGANSGAGNDTSTLTTPSFHPDVGEIIVVKAATWDSAQQMQTPVDGGLLTYTLRKTATGPNRCFVSLWTAEVLSDPGTMTISSTPTANCMHSMAVERWSGAKLAASPAVNGSPDFEPNSLGGAPASPITTVGTNSIVSFINTDWAARSTASRAYLLNATEDYLYDRSSTTDTVHYYAWAKVASPGTNNIGMSAPTNQFWAIAGIELESLAGGGTPTVNVDGTLSVTASRSADAQAVKSISGSLGVTAGLTANAPSTQDVTSSLGVTASLTSAASIVKPTSGAFTVTATSTANVDTGLSGVLAVTATTTAVADATKSISGSLAITTGLVAAATAVKLISGSRAVTVTSTTDLGPLSKPIAGSIPIAFDSNAAMDLLGQKTIIGELDLSVGLLADLTVVRSVSASPLAITFTPTAAVVRVKVVDGALVVTASSTAADQLIKPLSGTLAVNVGLTGLIPVVRGILAELGIEAVITADMESINIALPPDYVITKDDPTYTVFSGLFTMKATQSEIIIVSIREDDVVN